MSFTHLLVNHDRYDRYVILYRLVIKDIIYNKTIKAIKSLKNTKS